MKPSETSTIGIVAINNNSNKPLIGWKPLNPGAKLGWKTIRVYLEEISHTFSTPLEISSGTPCGAQTICAINELYKKISECR